MAIFVAVYETRRFAGGRSTGAPMRRGKKAREKFEWFSASGGLVTNGESKRYLFSRNAATGAVAVAATTRCGLIDDVFLQAKSRAMTTRRR